MPTACRGGVDLYFSDVGSGPAVLLHTGGGGDGRMWELAGYLEALGGYRVLVHDHRGHGRSSKPLGLENHRLVEYVDDVLAVLDAAGEQRAALVGYSDGIDVVLAVGACCPDRVPALVGIGAVGAPDASPSERRAQAAHVRFVGMRAAIEEFARAEPDPPPQWLLENLSSTDTEMFALELEGWADSLGVWASLSDVTAPSLLVCGELEEPEAAVHLEAAASKLRHGRSVMLEGLGHLGVFWRAELVLPVLTSFLGEHLPAAS